MRAQTLLITGANGFTGRYVAAAARVAGYRTVGLSTQETFAGAPLFDEICIANILAEEEVAEVVAQLRPDYVIHLAGVSLPSHEPFWEVYEVNLLGTVNLCKALERSGTNLKLAVFASSSHVYGPNAGTLRHSEEAELRPIGHYGISKSLMEDAVRSFATIPWLIVRPFNYTGRGQSTDFLVPKIVDAFAQHSEKLRLGDLYAERDISDVRDISDCYVDLLRASVSRAALNLCSGCAYSAASLLDTAEAVFGFRPEIVATGANEENRRNPQRILGDNSMLRSLLPSFSPRPMRATLQWMASGSDADAEG